MEGVAAIGKSRACNIWDELEAAPAHGCVLQLIPVPDDSFGLQEVQVWPCISFSDLHYELLKQAKQNEFCLAELFMAGGRIASSQGPRSKECAACLSAHCLAGLIALINRPLH